MKVSLKKSNTLLAFKWAYKPHFKRGIGLVNCRERAIQARTKVYAIVFRNAKSLVKWLLMTRALTESFLSFK